MYIPTRKNETVLASQANLEHKLNILTVLHERSQVKSNHFDDIRQQNLRYCILLFSGLIVLAFSVNLLIIRCSIVIGLVILMAVFLLQDKRLHKRTHAFRGTTYRALQAIAYLLGGGNDDITIWWYDSEEAKKAEKINLRLTLYWFLLAASVLSSIPLCFFGITLS